MSDASTVLRMIKEKEVKFVDLRFTDPRGKWQHLAMDVTMVDEDFFADGTMFDGSSIAGWKDISESDMTLMPDAGTAVLDPFSAQVTLVMFCDVLEPSTGEAYSRCPRSTAARAEAYLKYTGIGDSAVFGPEAEFFIFDDVRYDVSMNHTFYSLDDSEGPYNSGRQFDGGNTGHRPAVKGGYFPVQPVDSASDLRSEMLTLMTEMGLTVEKHHHEVAPSQHELGIKYDTLVRTADNMQIYKYVVHNVAHSYGKTATFMPKPVLDDNGSGMHVHQSIWKDGAPLFAGSGYADLSDAALYYIGGIIRHARALNAFTNPTTNSYKRLIPGFEAPVLLAYSARNRSAACRIPFATSPNGKRVEVRFPDPAANPYLGFAAMLMAGLDGIRNQIDPGEPLDVDLYDLSPEEAANVQQVPGSLEEVLDALEEDHDFLLAGDVFTSDLIENWLDYKRTNEIDPMRLRPHPYEFFLYFDT
ncbi:MAG: type I glutamate--ammonia ligase [Proteobacteria bacterium]|nr:type I glutamate--ammonia ligase [Pseudomonadota bacterium]